jgi:hypothetical protein
MDVLNHHFIRLGLTRAKALQTARRFPRETHRRFAVPKSNAFTLGPYSEAVDIVFLLFYGFLKKMR